MGKNKLSRWAEMKTFGNVIEPPTALAKEGNWPSKGKWKSELFKNNHPLVLELGCGKGEYTLGLAMKYTDKNHVGVDIKGARIWRGAKTAAENNIKNVMFLRTRIEFITSFFAEDEVDEIWITFPDPFPRPGQSGRRLTSPGFLNLYRMILRDGGIIHLKTDNPQLYRYTLNVANLNNLEIISDTDDLHASDCCDDILAIRTHYENIFLNDGEKIKYLSFRLEKNRKIENAYAEKQIQ